MTEKEYLDALNKALKWLPKPEKEICFNYAREMIEDRIENGLTETEAVAQLETPQQMAKLTEQIITQGIEVLEMDPYA